MTTTSNNLEPIQIINFNSSKNTKKKGILSNQQNECEEVMGYNNICDAVNCNNSASITLILPLSGTNNNSENNSITLQVCKDCKSKFE